MSQPNCSPASRAPEALPRRRSLFTPLLAAILCTLAALLTALATHTAAAQPPPDPGQPGPCAVSSQTVQVGGSLQTKIYQPVKSPACDAWATPPYPAIAFAHGFSMFGLSDGVAQNTGNAEHLASWGYVVALPALPDDAETRLTSLRSVLDYLAAGSSNPDSPLYGRVDAGRLAAAGHSLGGATALAVAGRDGRVKAVVALDPVYHEGSFTGGGEVWDPQVDGPKIKVPAGVLGAPSSSCNSQSDYEEIYPLIAAVHKTAYRINGASHCDFNDPGSAFCGITCGATDPARTTLSQKYMTSWLNYYLLNKAGYYSYLYGSLAGQDISNGAVTAQVDTAPHGLAASAQDGGIHLSWSLYLHPAISGYHIYRRLDGQGYPTSPYAQPGLVSEYIDAQVEPGRIYFYTVASYDPAGDEHQAAAEVSFVAPGAGPIETIAPPTPFPASYRRLFLPLLRR